MYNFTTGQRAVKSQKTEPRMKGFICIDSRPDLPEMNENGDRLFWDANNQPYYASEREDGFHYQP
jgi:hypothetical protein